MRIGLIVMLLVATPAMAEPVGFDCKTSYKIRKQINVAVDAGWWQDLDGKKAIVETGDSEVVLSRGEKPEIGMTRTSLNRITLILTEAYVLTGQEPNITEYQCKIVPPYDFLGQRKF